MKKLITLCLALFLVAVAWSFTVLGKDERAKAVGSLFHLTPDLKSASGWVDQDCKLFIIGQMLGNALDSHGVDHHFIEANQHGDPGGQEALWFFPADINSVRGGFSVGRQSEVGDQKFASEDLGRRVVKISKQRFFPIRLGL